MTYKPSRSVELPLREAYPFAVAHGFGAQAEHIRKTSPPASVHESVYRRGLMANFLRGHHLLDKSSESAGRMAQPPRGNPCLRAIVDGDVAVNGRDPTSFTESVAHLQEYRALHEEVQEAEK